jgi:hypothetical protein
MFRALLLATVVAAALGVGPGAFADTVPTLGEGSTTLLSTGQRISPAATPGTAFVPLNPGLSDAPHFVAGQPVSTALSPDRKTLLVLTSGYNNITDDHRSRRSFGRRLGSASNAVKPARQACCWDVLAFA